MIPLNKNRVLIVDDDEIIRESFVYIVNNSEKFTVVGAYNSAEEAISEVGKKKPDIVLMDIKLPGMTGVEGTQRIKDQFPHVEVVIVSVYEDSDLVFNALRAGASGYITKSSNYLELIAALEEIKKGGAPISSKIAKMVVQSFHLNPHSPLTKREKEVLILISEGKTYTQISDQLFISKETAKSHIRNIYGKLQVNRKSEAIEHAHLNKLI